MKRTNLRRNLFIGVLMGLVMVLGVQESADALIFGTARTGDLATKGINEDFTITFSVTLGGNTTPARNSAGQLISAPSTGSGVRIDSGGYPVTDIIVGGRSREYRNFENQPTTPTGGTFVIDPRPSRNTGGASAGTATTPYYISGSSIVDTNGRIVYVQTGDGSEATPWRYTPATPSLGTPAAQINNADRYHYNDERVTIAVTGANIIKVGNTFITGTASLTLRETLDGSTDARANTDAGTTLTSSVTLTLRATAAAVVEIDITDATPAADRPGAEAPQQDFTVYVVGPLNTTGQTSVVATTNGVQRVSDQQDTRIDGHFTFDPAANQPVYYTVEGSGRLYVSPAATGISSPVPNRKTPSTNNLYTSSSAPVFLDTTGGSSKVTAYIAGSGDTAKVLYVFSGARLNELPQITVQSGDNQTGAPSGRLDDYFEVKVTDGRRRPISGLPVMFTTTAPAVDGSATDAMFIPVPGTRVYTDATFDGPGSIDAERPTITVATTTNPRAVNTHRVQTDRNGVAKIYYQLSFSSVPHTVTADAHGIGTTANPLRATLTATASSSARARLANLEIVSGNNQRGEKGKYLKDDLVVIVRSLAGHRVQNAIIQFRTTAGTLVPAVGTTQPASVFGQNLETDDAPSPLHPRSGQQIYVQTGPNGEAGVSYNVGQVVEARDVIAEIREEAQTSTQYDFAIDRVVFRVNGGSSLRSPTTREPAAPRNIIGISPSSITGEPDEEITLSITSDPSVRFVTLSSDDFANSLFSPQSGTTPFQSTLTLPDEDGEYNISASSAGLTSATATVTVETGILGRITVLAIGQPSNGAQNFSIRVVDTDGDRISGTLTVRVSGSGFTTRNIETLDGVGDARLTLPTTAGLYTLTASAEDYTSGTTQVRIAAPEQQQGTDDEEEEEEVAEEETPTPSSIEISGPATRTGTANTAIEAALLVRVLDNRSNAIEDARVIFRVRKGQGRLSERGNGRAVAVQTDSRGYARTSYTPISASSTVEAEVRGVRETVTFTITTDGSAPPPTLETTPTTPRTRTVSPVVHLAAAQRPGMLWIDDGKIYALVQSDVQEFVPSVNNAQHITIGAGKVYWTEKTGDSAGTINSANLDGTEVTELTAIRAIPMGIAVDEANSLLYWTNSRGRIQSANLDGSRIQNVMENIRNPNDLALAGGNVYWTESNHGSVRFVNLKGQKQIRVISIGDDPAGSIAIAGGKVYWTEQVGESSGTINSANLNGSDPTELASIQATPIGIAVDRARSKLYWTNARGRVQSASLDGSSIRNVVTGLDMPGDIIFSNGLKLQAPTTTATTTTASKSKYDINGDGSVDDKDVDAIIVAVAAKITAAKYDVNGDGKVDFNDVVAVSANKESAASAPTLLGRQFSALEVDRLQEQIDLLIATGDRSPAAIKTLIYLQQLIAMARPEKTQLLANYPNPFNPETWMPYELATDTNVKITIYNAQGVVIRTLQLGQQSAGYYTGRERAAYWDGRNAFGEQVASGIYFYQLETDDMSSLRKMVILK